jgi:hypothetical protein
VQVTPVNGSTLGKGLRRNFISAYWYSLDPSWRYALSVYAVGRVALTIWSFTILAIFPQTLYNFTYKNMLVMASFDLVSSERQVYSRQVDGTALTFRAVGRDTARDVETGSLWSLHDGYASSGAYLGKTLTSLPELCEKIFPYLNVAPEANLFLSLWQRFDTNWYLAIAQFGYGAIDGDIHFAPLYPALIHLFAGGKNFYLIALAISNFALLGALVSLHRITCQNFDLPVATRTTIYFILFPTAFFLFSAYAESLFVLIALWTLQTLERRAWLWTGLWCFCAILIRLQGIALMVPIVYTIWSERQTEGRIARGVMLILSASAMGIYLFLRFVTGDVSMIPMAEPIFFARLVLPWENYFYAIQTILAGPFQFVDLLNFGVTTLSILALVIGWKKIPRTFALYTAASIIVLTMRLVETQPLNSMVRYTLTLLPIFMLMGAWEKSAQVKLVIVCTSFALALYLSAQFVIWGWVG